MFVECCLNDSHLLPLYMVVSRVNAQFNEEISFLKIIQEIINMEFVFYGQRIEGMQVVSHA